MEMQTAARSMNKPVFQRTYETAVTDALELLDCMFHEVSKKCGKISTDETMLRLIAQQQAMQCSNPSMKQANAICRGKNQREREVMTKGILCAAESGKTKDYVHQCYNGLRDKFPWDLMMRDVREGNRTSNDVLCYGKVGYEINQCMTLYGLIMNTCGKELADEYFRIMVVNQCTEKIEVPKAVAFDYKFGGTTDGVSLTTAEMVTPVTARPKKSQCSFRFLRYRVNIPCSIEKLNGVINE